MSNFYGPRFRKCSLPDVSFQSHIAKVFQLAIIACCLLSGVAAEAMPPLGSEGDGVIQSVDRKSATFTIKINDESRVRSVAWNKRTEFVKGVTFISSNALKAGEAVRVRYRVPIFGMPFVTRVVFFEPSPKNVSRSRAQSKTPKPRRK